jgi:integrase
VRTVDWKAVAGPAQRLVVPESERAGFCDSYTLRRLYADPVYGLEAVRRERVATGRLAASSLAKDRQALSRWERFASRPPDWPSGEPCEGAPLRWITDWYVTAWVTAACKELSLSSVRSTWSHVRIVLNRAVEIQAIERAPQPEWPKDDGSGRQAKELYGDRQLAEIYAALAGHVDLQVAFVVSVNAGLRTVDLFLLRWPDLRLQRERPVVEFTARKTGKRQCVPLAPCVVRQLDRWRRHQGWLFPPHEMEGLVWPELTEPAAADPERSRAARTRNARMKRVLRGIGIEPAKPWQVGRLTCNERFERHRPGSGQFILGHSRTLNSVSYREPSGLVYEAAATLPQPECF